MPRNALILSRAFTMFTVRWPSLLPQHFGKRAGKICRAGYKKKQHAEGKTHTHNSF